MDAIVFDFDGLILDTEWPEYLTVAEEFVRHGAELTIDDWQHVVGRADHPHWTEMLEDAIGCGIDREAAQRRRRQRHAEQIAAEHILPGVQRLVDSARADGIALAVASSSGREWVEGHLERLGLRPSFATVVTRDHVARAKPWPDLYELALARLGAAPSAAVALEDSHHGCAAAKAAGLACVVVPNRVTARQDFSHADLVAGSLAEVGLDVLAALLGSAEAPSGP